MKRIFLVVAVTAAFMIGEPSGQLVTCSVDGRAEWISGVGGFAMNYPGCGHIIGDPHVRWITVAGTGSLWLRWWNRHLVPQCPIDGWTPEGYKPIVAPLR